MCRLMVFKGHKSMLMEDLLTNPARSIVTQSYAAQERLTGNTGFLNGDGFGVGWYVPPEESDSVSERCC